MFCKTFLAKQPPPFIRMVSTHLKPIKLLKTLGLWPSLVLTIKGFINEYSYSQYKKWSIRKICVVLSFEYVWI